MSNVLSVGQLRPIQSLAASMLFRYRRLMLSLPRQFGGKTELGVRFSYDLTKRPFTSSALFLAKDRKSGKKATREKFERIFDKKDFVVNTEIVYLKKHPTSVVFMDSVDKDPDRIRGGTHSFIHWSEVAFAKIEHGFTISDVYQKIIDPTTALTDGYALLESTNNGKNGWFDLWHAAKDLGFVTLKIGLGQMVDMGLVDRDEYDRIKDKTLPEIFAQEYECDWVTFQGRTYPEFTERHVDADMPGPEGWQRVGSAIDWGYSPSATCILFGYVLGGVVHIFDEHYQKEELPAATAAAIEDKRIAWNIQRHATVADHDLARNQELNLRGIECFPANKSNVMGARMQLKEMFYFDKIRIHPRCKNLIRDLEAAVWDPKKEGEIDYGQCTWGHFDGEAALRYLVRELSSWEADEPEDRGLIENVAHDFYRERYGA